MSNLPTVTHPTGRPNFTRVQVGDLLIWFSYETPIAFHFPNEGLTIRENDWNRTTGGHLNEVDGGNKPGRIPGVEFERQLARRVGAGNVAFAAKRGVKA